MLIKDRNKWNEEGEERQLNKFAEKKEIATRFLYADFCGRVRLSAKIQQF